MIITHVDMGESHVHKIHIWCWYDYVAFCTYATALVNKFTLIESWLSTVIGMVAYLCPLHARKVCRQAHMIMIKCDLYILIMIDYIMFYAVSAIFRPYNGGDLYICIIMSTCKIIIYVDMQHNLSHMLTYLCCMLTSLCCMST